MGFLVLAGVLLATRAAVSPGPGPLPESPMVKGGERDTGNKVVVKVQPAREPAPPPASGSSLYEPREIRGEAARSGADAARGCGRLRGRQPVGGAQLIRLRRRQGVGAGGPCVGLHLRSQRRRGVTVAGDPVKARACYIKAREPMDVARQEVIAFQSMTLSDSDFLRGKTDGKPVTLAGYLLLPKAAPDVKQPAVILIHGSGGLGSSTGSNAEWQRELTNAGFAVFALDNFAGRGIVSTVADQSQLGRYNAIVDAYRALEVLAKHRNIDATKIAVMGFSRGGQSSTYPNLERFWKSYGSPDLQFAAHINVYSNCGWSLKDDDKVLKPMLFLHGSADDWALPASCREYSARLANTGTNIRFVEYPDAHHAFDAPAFKTPVKVAAGQKWSDCRVGEEKGELVNKDTGQPFSFSDACVKKGTTVAYHEEAAKKSHEDVKNFLKEVFGAK
jgi:dienelactone hydrolase